LNALITGSGRGIGKAIAYRFAKAGFNIAITSKHAEITNRTAAELQEDFPDIEVIAKAFDLSKKEEAAALASFVLSKWKTLDVLVNNAGIFMGGKLLDEEEGRLEYMLNTNLLSAYHLSRSLKDIFMRQRSGHIFNICSIASLKYYHNSASYGISKAAMYAFSNALRAELMPYRVRVSSILPGAVLTDSWPDRNLPKSRFIKVEDIANILYQIWKMPEHTLVEDIIMRPLEGDL